MPEEVGETVRLAREARIHQLATDPQKFQMMSLIMQINNRRDINDLKDNQVPALQSGLDDSRSTLQEQHGKVSRCTDAVIALQTSMNRQDEKIMRMVNDITELQTKLEECQLGLNTFANKQEVQDKSLDELGDKQRIGTWKPEDKLFLEGLAQRKEMFDALWELVGSSGGLYVLDKVVDRLRDKLLNAKLAVNQANGGNRAEPGSDVPSTADEEPWPEEILDAWHKLEKHTKYVNAGRCSDERKLILRYMENLHPRLFEWCQYMILAKCPQVGRLQVPLVRGRKKRIVNLNGLKWNEFRRALRRVKWNRIAEQIWKEKQTAAEIAARRQEGAALREQRRAGRDFAIRASSRDVC